MDDFFDEDVKVQAHSPLIITDEFELARQLLEETNSPVFITGDAGTGKSTLLKWFLSVTKKACVTIAPTGIAAVNVGGQTMHSFFKWPPRPMTSNDIKVLEDTEIFEKMDMLIIDEISMVRVDQMDFIDEFLRMNRGDNRPFGGVQVVMFGDLLQLPPVLTTEDGNTLNILGRYGSEFFFAADVWNTVELKTIKLTKIFRQQDPIFISILNKIRDATISYSEIDMLNSRRYTKEDEEKSAFLCAMNATADKINKDRIALLPGESYSYEMIKSGVTTNLASYIPETLTVKRGAKIMMLVNDGLGRWQNGTIGHVVECGKDTILVDIHGVEYWIARNKWESVRHKLKNDEIITSVDGFVEQFPFKVAYAISVHKSQGQTFESIIIDFGARAFAPGMAYVAISRCKTLEGVFFSTPLRKSDIYFDEKVIKFLKDGKYVRE